MYRQIMVSAVALVFYQTLAGCRSRAASDPVVVVRQYVAAQNEHDLGAMLTLLADPVDLHVGFPDAQGPVVALHLSGEQRRAQFEKAFQSQPSVRFQIVDILTEGAVVVTRERASGLPPETAAVGLCVYRVRGGRIDYMWVIPPVALSG